jgi:hypothetical protein
MALIIIIFFSSVNFYFLTGVELNFLQRRSRLKVSKRKKGENLGVKKHGGSVGWPAHLPLFLLGRSQRVGRTRIHRFCIYIYILYLRLLVYLFLYLLMCVIYERENGGNWWRGDESGEEVSGDGWTHANTFQTQREFGKAHLSRKRREI